MKGIKLLRITTVSHSLDLLLKGQLKYISSKGFNVYIACSKDKNVSNIERREGVTYHELYLTRTFNPIQDIISLFKAIRLLVKLKPAIVHTHSPKAGIVGMIASYFCRIPLKIHTVAGLPLTEAKGIKKWILTKVEKITYRCADFVLSNSVNQKEYIEKYIYKGHKLKVIGKGSSNGIDLEYFDPSLFTRDDIDLLKAKYNISEDDVVYCFVGRLANYKGINELIEVFERLNKKYKETKLFLIGPYEDLNPLDSRTIQLIKCNNNIIALGHQDDVRSFMVMSDIFVFPSYREGFPQALMQAAAMKLSCIASDINGCVEIIEDGKTGLIVPPKDVDALYNASEKLLKNKHLRKQYSENARITMEHDFEQKAFWNKLIQFYKDHYNTL